MTEIALNRRQRYQLQQQLRHTRDAALYRRTFALLEIDKGHSVAEVADALGVSRQSVYNWMETYADGGDPLALADAERSGRPSSWSPELQNLLATLLRESPTQWGFAAVNWTVPLLREQLASWDGRWLSPDTIRRQLHEIGYVWKRTRYALPEDPDQEKKNGDSPAAAKPAPAQRRAVRGRDRSAVVPAAAGHLGAEGTAGAGPDQWR
jgi:transposase